LYECTRIFLVGFYRYVGLRLREGGRDAKVGCFNSKLVTIFINLGAVIQAFGVSGVFLDDGDSAVLFFVGSVLVLRCSGEDTAAVGVVASVGAGQINFWGQRVK
jgi:hypothetical protein